MKIDHREWVEQRACDLAQELYSKPYCDLPPVLQQLVSADAEKDYISYYSGRLDAAYDAERDRRMEESQRKCCDCPVGSNYCGR